jgi:hypothetical protein
MSSIMHSDIYATQSNPEIPSRQADGNCNVGSVETGRCPRRVNLLCDFRDRCALISDLFPDRTAFALLSINSTPHLAEALFQSGLISDGRAAINMALAIQEARGCPPRGCSCTLVSKPQRPI